MLYIVETTHEWGSYGSVYLEGIVSRTCENGDIEIERTGPYLPEFAVYSGKLYVSESVLDSFLGKWEEYVRVLHVHYSKVVKTNISIDNIEEMMDLPGEPEDLILNGINDDNLREMMPRLHAIVPKNEIEIDIYKWIDYSSASATFTENPLAPPPLFGGIRPGGMVMLCTDIFREWIQCNNSWKRLLNFRKIT